MSTGSINDAELEQQAHVFASRLSSTVRSVLSEHAPEFNVEATPSSTGGDVRLVVKPDGGGEIPLSIAGEHALDLAVDYLCVWDHRGHYLKVSQANFRVLTVGYGDPIFRYEFVAAAEGTPSAHLHVHAHRDEILYSLVRAGKGRAKSRSEAMTDAKRTPPRLSGIHFPLGGPRMRPVLEDVLQMLISEFCIDTQPKALTTLEEGRLHWRRDQVAACARDAPEHAVRALESLGYRVEWLGPGPEPSERRERLVQY